MPEPPTSVFRPDLFEKKTVLVTGGSSGIGFGIAKAFARHGAHVFVTGRDKEKLGAAVDTLLDEHDYVEGHAFDVRERDTVTEIADMLHEDYGPMDVVVNNAAGNFMVPFGQMSDNAWDAVTDIVLKGTANVTKAFGRHMAHAGRVEARESRPIDRSILNIVAGYAWTGAPGVSHSGAAKAGVLNLTKSVAVEWAPAGVRANAISPGPISDTGGASKLWESEHAPPGMGKMIQNTVPMHRFGTPDDVGAAALWLGSVGAGYVTGTCVVVDGGMDAVGPFPIMAQMAQQAGAADD